GDGGGAGSNLGKELGEIEVGGGGDFLDADAATEEGGFRRAGEGKVGAEAFAHGGRKTEAGLMHGDGEIEAQRGLEGDTAGGGKGAAAKRAVEADDIQAVGGEFQRAVAVLQADGKAARRGADVGERDAAGDGGSGERTGHGQRELGFAAGGEVGGEGLGERHIDGDVEMQIHGCRAGEGNGAAEIEAGVGALEVGGGEGQNAVGENQADGGGGGKLNGGGVGLSGIGRESGVEAGEFDLGLDLVERAQRAAGGSVDGGLPAQLLGKGGGVGNEKRGERNGAGVEAGSEGEASGEA